MPHLYQLHVDHMFNVAKQPEVFKGALSKQHQATMEFWGRGAHA